MPTNQPSNAPDEMPNEPRDKDNAASVLTDENLDDALGGGGLGGAAAAAPLAGSGRAPSGTSRNSPIDVPVPRHAADSEAKAQKEAALQAVNEDAPEPHPKSL